MDAFLTTANDAAARTELGAAGLAANTFTGVQSLGDSLAFGTNSATSITRGIQSLSTADISIITSGNRSWAFSGTQLYALGGSNGQFVAGPGEYNMGNSSDTTIRAGGAGGVTAACVQLGTRSATPIAQTLQACPGIGTNIAGADFSIVASNGTGTGGSGSLLFKTAPVAGSGSTINTLATRLTIDNTGAVIVASGGNFQLGNTATTGLVAGALAALTTASVVIYDSTGQAYRIPCII